MRRVRRYILNGLTVASAAICAVTAALVVASYVYHGATWDDPGGFTRTVGPQVVSVTQRTYSLYRGTFSYVRQDSYTNAYEGLHKLHTLWAVPLWPILIATAVLPFTRILQWGLLRWPFRTLAERRRLAGRCPACGYDLRATPARCPECGLAPP